MPSPARFALALSIGMFGLIARQASAQDSSYLYVVKVACDTGTTTGKDLAIVRQPYATLINIFNPGDVSVKLAKSFASGLPGERPSRPRPIETITVPARSLVVVDCNDLTLHVKFPPSPFFEGDVLLLSSAHLDVQAMYQVPGGVDVVRVPETPKR